MRRVRKRDRQLETGVQVQLTFRFFNDVEQLYGLGKHGKETEKRMDVLRASIQFQPIRRQKMLSSHSPGNPFFFFCCASVPLLYQTHTANMPLCPSSTGTTNQHASHTQQEPVRLSLSLCAANVLRLFACVLIFIVVFLQRSDRRRDGGKRKFVYIAHTAQQHSNAGVRGGARGAKCKPSPPLLVFSRCSSPPPMLTCASPLHPLPVLRSLMP